MRTTIRDVAETAGVSAMAVSAVLHGTGRNVKVSVEKAEQIRQAARDLRYRPNHLARSLRNRKTQTVGVVFQHFDRLNDDNPYYPQLLNGVMAALFPADYTLALCPKLVLAGADSSISDGRFDGVLWCRPDFTEASMDDVRSSNIPVVMMHAPPGSAPGVPTFCADNEGALQMVVSHLTGLGHVRLGFVIDPVVLNTAEGLARQAAFLRSCEEANVQGDIVVWGYDAPELDAYRSYDPPHTALAAFSDHHAGRLLLACKRFGIRVPHDLSIVGFDSSSLCEATSPRLTAVYQPVERIAYQATTHLLAMIREEQEGSSSNLPISSIYECGFDVRESTSRPHTSPKRSFK